MSDAPAEPAAPEPKGPFWRNPFFLAFVIGAAVLTVLPRLQRPFLKAPPPIRSLTPWALTPVAGPAVSAEALKGKVWLATVEPGPCDAECVARQEAFGRGAAHVDDLGGAVVFVSVLGAPALQGLAGLTAGASDAWRFATGSPEALDGLVGQLQQALVSWADEGRAVDFAAAHALVLVDQEGAVRGFWTEDGAGRGNSINAARLLAKHGPTP